MNNGGSHVVVALGRALSVFMLVVTGAVGVGIAEGVAMVMAAAAQEKNAGNIDYQTEHGEGCARSSAPPF
jgi:hypothetical protein